MLNDGLSGIFFSKDRKEEVIEIEEEAKIAHVHDCEDPVKLINQGQWMKGCPERSEQSFLFGQYTALSEGVCACPENCGHSVPREKANFFALYVCIFTYSIRIVLTSSRQPQFTMYISHLKAITRQTCTKCKTVFCLACGERVTPERDFQGRLVLDENPLYHCADLQGVILGVGLTMLEQVFADQVADAAARSAGASTTKPSGNTKKRKADTNALHTPMDPDDVDDLYYSTGKGKKAKGGVGYAGNVREDVTLSSIVSGSDLTSYIDVWPVRSFSRPKG